MTPITVVKNGEGPTALLTGGNHGDEHEGITSLLKFAIKLRAEDVQGRVIIVPMMNAPAGASWHTHVAHRQRQYETMLSRRPCRHADRAHG